ncbi:thioredoxin [Hymenobacter lapidiphilus]|uniref:Thioredoxin n=1 Tax=Hymenobacter lapidiphilus TaxID=2608003 RepID=A0A7Y7PQ10_9BACT|nr:thioredoxin [Hymenobacter lapidiphilus]NVO31930.1 thioredoxin [Hymenobacter lapidiphilus]
MAVVASPSTLVPEATVLLVLLPPAVAGQAPALSIGALRALQARLGPGVRVLRVDEASHPTVVRSFSGQPATLPACVLVRQGVELWRQSGLPQAEIIEARLRQG